MEHGEFIYQIWRLYTLCVTNRNFLKVGNLGDLGADHFCEPRPQQTYAWIPISSLDSSAFLALSLEAIANVQATTTIQQTVRIRTIRILC